MGHPGDGSVYAGGGCGRPDDGQRFARPLSVVGASATDDVQLERAVGRAQAGSREAMRYLYCRYADTVYCYVRGILGDEYEAEDVTQAVFAKLMTRIGSYEPRGVPFSAWLLRVARNAALDDLRQRRPLPTDDLRRADGESEPDDDGRRDVAIRDAMRELTSAQRRVVFLRHVAGLTPPEIADRTGTSEAAVHGLHHRGRLALQRALEQRGARPSVRSDGPSRRAAS